jgi:hypothetical protein
MFAGVIQWGMIRGFTAPDVRLGGYSATRRQYRPFVHPKK